jgi:hypothetical protein
MCNGEGKYKIFKVCSDLSREITKIHSSVALHEHAAYPQKQVIAIRPFATKDIAAIQCFCESWSVT